MTTRYAVHIVMEWNSMGQCVSHTNLTILIKTNLNRGQTRAGKLARYRQRANLSQNAHNIGTKTMAKQILKANVNPKSEPIALKSGALSKKEQEIVDFAKETFKVGRERDLVVADNVILFRAQTMGEKWDDLEGEELVEFLESLEQEVAKVAVTDVGITKLAGKLDAAALKVIDDNVEAVKVGKISAVTTYAQFKRIYTKDELDSMPYPGTEIDSLVGNHKPDIVKKKAANGDVVRTVWTDDFVYAMPEGKKWSDELSLIRKEKGSSGSVPTLKNVGKKDLLAMESDVSSSLNALKAMVRRTIELHHQFEGIKGMPLVGIKWIETEKAKHIVMPEAFGKGSPAIKVTTSPKSIWIFPEGKSENGKVYSVTQLNSFDIALAIANGGTMDKLTDTAKKGSNDQGEGTNDGSTMTSDEAYSDVNRFINFINRSDNLAQINLILGNKKHELHKDWLENINSLKIAIDPIYRKYKSEIEEVTQTKTNESEAA